MAAVVGRLDRGRKRHLGRARGGLHRLHSGPRVRGQRPLNPGWRRPVQAGVPARDHRPGGPRAAVARPGHHRCHGSDLLQRIPAHVPRPVGLQPRLVPQYRVRRHDRGSGEPRGDRPSALGHLRRRLRLQPLPGGVRSMGRAGRTASPPSSRPARRPRRSPSSEPRPVAQLRVARLAIVEPMPIEPAGAVIGRYRTTPRAPRRWRRVLASRSCEGSGWPADRCRR